MKGGVYRMLTMEQDEIYYFTAQKRIKDAYERFNGGG